MTLEGANKFHETDSYVIYTMNSATTGQYCVILPKNISGVMNMLVDLHMKRSFDGIPAGTKTKEQLIDELGKEYINVKEKYANAMLVFPMIDEGMLQSAVVNNDKQKMFDEVKKIGAITSEIYKKLTGSGVEKQNIDQKIIIVEKNEEDGRFVSWLKEQMPNFVDGIRYSELESKEVVVNPFMDNATNSIFGAPVNDNASVNPASVSTSSVGGGIFDTVAPSVSVPSVEPTSVPTAVPETNSVNSGVDIFGIPTNVVGVAPVAEPVVSNPTPEVAPAVEVNNTVPPVSNPAPSAPPVSPSVEPMGSMIAPAPQPVNSVDLEGTTTFSPIPNSNVASPANGVVDQNAGEEVVVEKGSKGFVNLIILLVVLVGVTIASIELGKFLYSVYGA